MPRLTFWRAIFPADIVQPNVMSIDVLGKAFQASLQFYFTIYAGNHLSVVKYKMIWIGEVTISKVTVSGVTSSRIGKEDL